MTVLASGSTELAAEEPHWIVAAARARHDADVVTPSAEPAGPPSGRVAVLGPDSAVPCRSARLTAVLLRLNFSPAADAATAHARGRLARRGLHRRGRAAPVGESQLSPPPPGMLERLRLGVACTWQ